MLRPVKNWKDGVFSASSFCTLISCTVVAVGVLGEAYWREESGGCFTFHPEHHLMALALNVYHFSPILRYFKDFFLTILTILLLNMSKSVTLNTSLLPVPSKEGGGG